jgi:hypothetical protein
MRRRLLSAVGSLACLVVIGDSACSQNLASNPSNARIQVQLTSAPPSSASSRLPLSFTTPETFTLDLQALKEDGTRDTTFNGYVRLSAQPGSLDQVTGPDTNGRNVLLKNGEASGISVSVLAGYGNTNLWAEDEGYVPVDPARVCTAGSSCPSWCKAGSPCPPACSNGIDDNGNGLIDYPNDPGCYAANDDTEDGGSYSAGISPTIYYYVPRIADIRGGPEGGTGTPFPSDAVTMDCGYRNSDQYAFDVIVTRVSSSGFYVTDLGENALVNGGFGSVFAYNFAAPPNMRQCDRLRSFGGTTADFYGFTEVNYPTWELEEWNPAERSCGIPEPHTLAPACNCPTLGACCASLPSQLQSNCQKLSQGLNDGACLSMLTPLLSAGACSDAAPLSDCVAIPTGGENSTAMLSVAAALVRVSTQATPPTSANPSGTIGTLVQVSSLFGPGHPQAPNYAPTADATDCDLNNDGKVDRTAGSPELTCANACAANLQCSEYSNYLSENQFNLVVTQVTGWTASSSSPGTYTPTGTSVDIQADGSSDAQFNPVLLKGNYIGAFTGTLYYFSGGAQYTIQARCADDIVLAVGGSEIPSDTACVHARTILDTSEGSN